VCSLAAAGRPKTSKKKTMSAPNWIGFDLGIGVMYLLISLTLFFLSHSRNIGRSHGCAVQTRRAAIVESRLLPRLSRRKTKLSVKYRVL
jgi:hypothetical protein